MLNWLFLLLSLLQTGALQNQAPEIDSLEQELVLAVGRERMELLNRLSELYSHRQPQKTIEYGKQALELAEQENDLQGKAVALQNIGQGYEYLSFYDSALDHYMRSLSLFESLKDSSRIARSLNLIGFIYWYLNNLDQAIDYYERSLKIAKSINDQFRIVTDLNAIGLVQWAKGDFQTALRYYQEALKIAEQRNYDDRLAAIYNNMGLVYLDQKRFPEALNAYRKALQINQKLKRPLSIIENLNNLGNTYLKLGDFSRAKEYLSRAREMAIQAESKYLLNDNNFYFYSFYLQQKNPEKALEFYRLYAELNDSLVSAEKRARINELQTMHLMEQKENEIKLLKMEQQLKEAHLKVQRDWLIFLSVLLVVTAGALGIIAHQNISKNRAYKVLVKKNLKIVEYERKLIELLKHSDVPAKEDLLKEAELMGFQEVQAAVSDPPEAKKPETDSPEARKYSYSPLTEEQKERLADDIITLMEEKKMYLDSDISISKLAEALQVNRTYVSQIINEKFHKSFTNFINDYRIKEARRLLFEDRERLYTIEAVARSVGFNSVNAFNRAFKRFTGITPSYFIQVVRGEEKKRGMNASRG